MKKFCFTFLLVGLAILSFGQTIGGIGVVMKLDTLKKSGDTYPIIMEAVANGPAALAGMQKGEHIVSADGLDCKNERLEKIVERIRGVAGTKVVLEVAGEKISKTRRIELTRVNIQQQAPPDPATVFHNWSEQQTLAIRKERHKVVKTFPSECGDFFFSFEAGEGVFKALVFVAIKEGTPDIIPAAKLYDNSNESHSVELASADAHSIGGLKIYELNGELSLERNSVGVVSTVLRTVNGSYDCAGLYVIVYQ